jgi:hypothetical protein
MRSEKWNWAKDDFERKRPFYFRDKILSPLYVRFRTDKYLIVLLFYTKDTVTNFFDNHCNRHWALRSTYFLLSSAIFIREVAE